jgi:2-polyprenyl-6-methoxyphenol hydroxylase-like FAD-dependent oxidoreductase
MSPPDPHPGHRRTALVIGGGIAGPVLAMLLQRAGLVPTIYEGRTGPADDAGAFLNLAPNGLAVLETLGLADAVRAAGTPTRRIVFQNHRGKRLGELPETTILVKRGALHRTVRDAAVARGVRFLFGKRLTGVLRLPEGGVVARFGDGTEARGDLLLGCDGIHSTTRRLIMPEAPRPAYTGHVDTGGFSPAPAGSAADGVMRMTFGLRGFFGYQVVPEGEVFWFENLDVASESRARELAGVSDAEWRRRLLEVHEGDPALIAETIRASGPAGRWPIYDLPSLPVWHRGPVCLLGDAAHATSPHAGQGASLALEDAVVLARALRDIPDIERAFATFEAQRRERVERLVREARRQGSRKTAVGPIVRRVRDLLLPVFLRLGVRNLRKIYDYRVDWAQRSAV